MTVSTLQADLEPRFVGDISGRFFIPAYQRGYRWGRDEVKRLLDDIWESVGSAYYLQPVVVKKHEDEWELVDGQQRLTTLFLIVQYMKTEGLQSADPTYSLRYETRESSAAYLADPDPAKSQENIDFFHIFEAYRCISEWFESHGARRQFVANKFYGALFEDVKVIWYEATEDVDATTLFTRLNVGRIPLTDAELVKALLLSECAAKDTATNRAFEIAAQWDTFERDLREPELWAFITGSSVEDPTHISLLLDSIAGGPTGRDRPLFYTFESLRQEIIDDPIQFWNKVIDRHSLIIGWYQNRSLFHKIGFLVAEGTPFGQLITLAQGKTKSSFEDDLDDRIRRVLNLSEADLRDLKYQSAGTARALLLMNVETIRSRDHSAERYSFREHAVGRWSLEHIHAQNAESLNRAEQWETWLRLHRRALAAASGLDEGHRTALLDRVDQVLATDPVKETSFRPLERDLTAILSAGDKSDWDVDSIGNLALLDGDDNSALNNSVFAVKRAEILELDHAGSYIPVCTRNVFLKYYSPAVEHQMHFWSADDRESYLKEMVNKLRPYLSSETEEVAEQ